MVTQTFMDMEERRLLKKFHTLLGKAGIGQDGKEAILHSYGVESSRDLTADQLLDVCNKLTIQANPDMAKLDRYRKRAIAAIFGYYKAIGKDVSMDYVKGTACRSAGFEAFNTIPAERLNNLYYAFRDKAKDREAVSGIAGEELLRHVSLN